LVTNSDKESANTFVLIFNQSLSENKCVVAVLESIGDPVLLGKNGRRVDNEFVSLLIKGSSCLHLDGIVTIAKFGEAEAASNVKVVNLVEQILVSGSVQSHNRASKQIVMDGEFDNSRSVNLRQKFVS
jgi:hypothetical protein